MAMPYLPPVRSTAPVADLGFMTLPVERTEGGSTDNPWNPEQEFNPFLQGYFSGGKWIPYKPGKIVLGQRESAPVPGASSATPTVGRATQMSGGRNVQMNAQGQAYSDTPQRQFEASAASTPTRMSEMVPFTGLGFGEAGQPDYRFMPGEFSSMTPGTSSQFYSTQPTSLNPTPNPLLGVLQPWNPALDALKSSRRSP